MVEREIGPVVRPCTLRVGALHLRLSRSPVAIWPQERPVGYKAHGVATRHQGELRRQRLYIAQGTVGMLWEENMTARNQPVPCPISFRAVISVDWPQIAAEAIRCQCSPLPCRGSGGRVVRSHVSAIGGLGVTSRNRCSNRGLPGCYRKCRRPERLHHRQSERPPCHCHRSER